MNSYFALTFLLIACLTSNSDARRSREREIVRLSELIKFSYRFDLFERDAERVETRTRHRITEHKSLSDGEDDHDTYTQEYGYTVTETETATHSEYHTEETHATESEYFTETETDFFTETETNTETETEPICSVLSNEVDQECFQEDTCPTTLSPSCCSAMTDFTNENCTDKTALVCTQQTSLSAFFKEKCAITVQLTMELPIAKSDFNDNAKTAFVNTVSQQADVPTSDIKIASVTENVQKQASITVITQVTVANANQATNCKNSLSDVTAFVTVLNSNFQTLGVSIVVDANQVRLTVVTNNPSNPTSTRSLSASMSPSPTVSATASTSHSISESVTASVSVGASPSTTSSNLPTTSPSATVSVSATTTAAVSPSSTAEASVSGTPAPSQSVSVSAVALSPSATTSPSPTHAIIHVSSASRSAVTAVTVVLAMIVAIFI